MDTDYRSTLTLHAATERLETLWRTGGVPTENCDINKLIALSRDGRDNIYFKELTVSPFRILSEDVCVFRELNTVTAKLQKSEAKLCDNRLWLGSLIGGADHGR